MPTPCPDPPTHPQLVQVINDDYNDFVALSTKLVNIDGAVLRMQKPLLELKVGGLVACGWLGLGLP